MKHSPCLEMSNYRFVYCFVWDALAQTEGAGNVSWDKNGYPPKTIPVRFPWDMLVVFFWEDAYSKPDHVL